MGVKEHQSFLIPRTRVMKEMWSVAGIVPVPRGNEFVLGRLASWEKYGFNWDIYGQLLKIPSFSWLLE